MQPYSCLILQVEVEVLSAVLSPGVAGPEAEPGTTAFEKSMFPEMVNGPPIVFPVMAISMVRQSFNGN